MTAVASKATYFELVTRHPSTLLPFGSELRRHGVFSSKERAEKHIEVLVRQAHPDPEEGFSLPTDLGEGFRIYKESIDMYGSESESYWDYDVNGKFLKHYFYD
jgi:hypothetical protein